MYDKKRVSYIRKPAQFFLTKVTSDPEFFYFKPDKSISPKMRDDQGGVLKLRIALGISHAFSDLSIGGWNKKIEKPAYEKGFLFANIYHVNFYLFINFFFF